MTELEKEFIGRGSVKGFRFKQVYADDCGYIYQVDDEDGNTWYEVFKRTIAKEADAIIGGNKVHFDERVLYPSDTAFGVWALCCHSYIKAKGYIEEFMLQESKVSSNLFY